MPESPNASPQIAIIGAGMAGLTAGRTLAARGLAVTLFDKGRGVGGRMATRRFETAGQFDHGAQYFTAKSPEFRQVLAEWEKEGVAAEWTGTIGSLAAGVFIPEESPRTRYVGTPRMSAIGRHLASDLDVRKGVRVAPPQRREGGWELRDEDGAELGMFEWLIVTAPPLQTQELLGDLAIARLTRTPMSGCWATMVRFARRLDTPFDGAFVQHSPLAWIARDSSKPGRPAEECWVLHAAPRWSDVNIEAAPAAIAEQSLAFFQDAIRQPLPEVLEVSAHRWRYALPSEPLPRRSIVDAAKCVAACGDWCGGPRVEGAFLSGQDAAQSVLAELNAT